LRLTEGSGCFWGIEKSFRNAFPALLDIQVGYAGGKSAEVSYKLVCGGSTGHAEVVQMKFDPKTVTYQTLLDHFYGMNLPTHLGNHIKSQYRNAIFYHNETQQKLAKEAALRLATNYGGEITTTIEKLNVYVAAELYHQNYLSKY
jgi:peptide-methionine (S)-S-oxide reductase